MAATPSIDNIFDDDVQIDIIPPARPLSTDVIELDDDAPPQRRSRQPLFLADSDDDMDIDSMVTQGRNVVRPPSPHEIDVDEIFGDLGDFDDDMPASRATAPLDEEAMMREAEARIRKTTTLHEILPSSSPVRNMSEGRDDDEAPTKSGKKKSNKDADGDEKKARRRVMKLDENRLLGPSGFPQLISMTKDFKIKGKGHEATDLNRLLQVYQYWTHQLYPKTPFKDTVERVEKLTHSRRMHVALSVWKDEGKGIQPKQASDESEEEDEQGNQSNNDTQPIPRQSDRRSSGRSSPLPASSPPLSPRARNNDSRASDLVETTRRGGAEPLFLEDDEDEALWNAMGEFEVEAASSVPPSAPISAANSSMDDDDDLWNMAHEMHHDPEPTNPTGTAVNLSVTSSSVEKVLNSAPDPLDDDDDDDMYV